MRNKLTFFFSLFVLLFLITTIGSQIQAQTINVTVRCNTSTNPDTLDANDVVQVRGQSTGTVTPAITWGTDSGIRMTNKGGDYWETTFKITAGATLNYKFWTGFSLSPETGTSFNSGWEGNLNGGGGNRLFVAGTKDTTIDLQYYNGATPEKPQYWRPFASKTDTMAIYFRVNMGGADFDPAVNLVDVRGGAPLGSWATIITLSREAGSVNAGSFWSGVAYIAKSAVTVGAVQEFKFVIQPENWESTSNRSFTINSTTDTTIHWYYFNNRAPSGPKVTADILWRLKLDALEDAGLFNRSLGDKVAVTGAKGWPPSGFTFDTEPAMLKMTYNASEEEWNLLESFSKYPNEVIPYKYFISWDPSRGDSTSPNFIRGLDLTNNGWEEPGVTGGADRSYTYTSETQQLLPGDFGNEQQFFNSLDPKGVIKTPIAVTFNINMAPATDVNANATNPLFRPGTDTAYIEFDGSFVPITQGLPMYSVLNRVMLTDADGNGIYSGTLNLTPPTFNQLCFHVVYTSTSGDIENGGGTLRGRRYYQYIHPSSVTQAGATWPASFVLPELPWRNDSLDIEDPPTFVVSVRDNKILPGQFSISQNYPNPFNPSTMIQYNIPVTSNVKLQVFDITGRLVKTLSNQEETPGIHMVSWNGIDNAGQGVATGIYFLKINAGSYTNTIKMMFLK